MDWKEYFYNTIHQCFSTAIFTRYGGIAIASANDDDEDKQFRFVAYELPSEEINKLQPEERTKHIIVDKTYDISDVNFYEKFSVLQKINDLVTSFEVEVYSN